MSRTLVAAVCALVMTGCGERSSTQTAPDARSDTGSGAVAYVGASIWDGTGAAPVTGKSLVVEDGRVTGVVDSPPPGATVVDFSGRWIVPGFVNAHGHVSGRWADDGVTDPADKVRGDLSLYARYGVTSVVSLGGAGPEAFAVRNDQESSALTHARVWLAGAVVAGDTPEDARETALANVEAGVDWIKLRVDDGLGQGTKMPWDAIHATLDVAREAGLPVATHIFYLEDAQRLLEMGTDLIAHSVRDQKVTEEFTQAMSDTGVCYVPTLTREISTFVYESRPAFFDDPFFLEAASESEIARVSNPDFMAQMAASPAAAGYKVALRQATENLKLVVDAGVPVAFGTDTGPGGRFLGYFEHMEFAMMADAGMTPEQILLSATSVAADCVQLDDVGTLQAGKWADFVVLAENPLEDIRATRSITNVFIAGNAVDRD